MKVKQTAFVTGASSGIGLAVAHRLLEDGFEVSGVARDFSDTDCQSMQTYPLDLSEIDTLPQLLSQFSAAYDVLVLSAGYGQFGGLEQFSHRQIRQLVDTNLVSNLYLLKHFLPKMNAQKRGDIVIIGSESALQGGKSGAVYSATKFAIRGLAQSLRKDCALNNIRVILINPGPVDSDFFDALSFSPKQGQEFVIQTDAIADSIVSALNQPSNVVIEEINVQPLKRSFSKRESV